MNNKILLPSSVFYFNLYFGVKFNYSSTKNFIQKELDRIYKEQDIIESKEEFSKGFYEFYKNPSKEWYNMKFNLI